MNHSCTFYNLMVRCLAQFTISSNWLCISSTCRSNSTTLGCSFSFTVFKQATLNCSDRVWAASISIWESPTAIMLVIRSLFMVSARVRKVRCFHSLKPSIKVKEEEWITWHDFLEVGTSRDDVDSVLLWVHDQLLVEFGQEAPWRELHPTLTCICDDVRWTHLNWLPQNLNN